jgi:hypothetical protein
MLEFLLYTKYKFELRYNQVVLEIHAVARYICPILLNILYISAILCYIHFLLMCFYS